MITAKVLYQSSGKPAEGRKVSVYVRKLLSGGVTAPQYTDSNGEAHFDIESTEGDIYVDGTTRHSGRLAGRIVVYI